VGDLQRVHELGEIGEIEDRDMPTGKVIATGTRAFLHGIFGVGPVKGAMLYDLWGEDAMRVLLDKPTKVVEGVGSARMTNTLTRSIRSIGLWNGMVADFTRPLGGRHWSQLVADYEARRRRGEEVEEHWLERVDMKCIVGARLARSRFPDRLWDWEDELQSVFHRFEYDVGRGEVVCGVFKGREIYLHVGSWDENRGGCLYGMSFW
jgi:hypothetical protein